MGSASRKVWAVRLHEAPADNRALGMTCCDPGANPPLSAKYAQSDLEAGDVPVGHADGTSLAAVVDLHQRLKRRGERTRCRGAEVGGGWVDGMEGGGMSGLECLSVGES